MNLSVITPAPVRHSVHVAAPVARAFQVFTAGMNRWWLREHKIGPAALKEVVIEPRSGGRWYEIDDDGSTCDWGKVLAWEPPGRLLLAWQIAAGFTYDPTLLTEVEVTIVDEDGGTRVTLEHRNLERFGDKATVMQAAVNRGWPALLGEFAKSVRA